MITIMVKMQDKAAEIILGYAKARGLEFDQALNLLLLTQIPGPRAMDKPDPHPVMHRRDTGLPYEIRTKVIKVLEDGGWHGTDALIHEIGLDSDPEATKTLRVAMSHAVRDGTVERYPPAVKGRHFHGDIQYHLAKGESE